MKLLTLHTLHTYYPRCYLAILPRESRLNVALEQNAERRFIDRQVSAGGEISSLRYEWPELKTRHSAIDLIDSTVSYRGVARATR